MTPVPLHSTIFPIQAEMISVYLPLAPLRLLLAFQAAYFLLTGIWPLVHIRSFMAVTGPKRDLWLVRTVGVLITVVGAVLAAAAWNGNFSFEIFLLAVGCAAALTAIDVIYVTNGTISPIYLADAALEILLIVLWVVLWV
jgi:hypothetical protein